MDSDQIKTDTPTSERVPDTVALASIFFEDGMTYLRLGDLHSACDMLRRACTSDPEKGLYLAYHAYSVFRRDFAVEDVVEKTLVSLGKAIEISPTDPDVHLIVARFHLKCLDIPAAERSLERSRQIDPQNPNLPSVERALMRAKSAPAD